MIYSLGDSRPEIHTTAWVAPTAVIIGKVRLKARSSVWFGSVLRGDNEWIEIGEETNVQDNCTLHTDIGFPLVVGDQCTIGHQVVLHGCTIGHESLIGMRSTVMNGATIGDQCVVGAASLITENKKFDIPRKLILGSPADAQRDLRPNDVVALQKSSKHYVERAEQFASGLIKAEHLQDQDVFKR